MSDIRDQYIAQVVRGKSFAEVGGLWGTVNEKVSVAYHSGATNLTMIDITPLEPDPMQLWVKFRNRMADFGIQNYQCISQDISRISELQEIPKFDVVHCAGVLYHHPNPIFLLSALRQIASRHLILTSAITQQVIRNDAGEYSLPSSAVMFVPALSDLEFQVQSNYWSKVVSPTAQGLTERSFFDLKDFGPWWWLPTPSAMLAMCETVGFRATDLELTWNNNALTILLETVDDRSQNRIPQSLTRTEHVRSKLHQIEQMVSCKGVVTVSNERIAELSDEANVQKQLRRSQKRVKKLQEKLQHAHQLQQRLEQTEARIDAMESSKFWKLRLQWIRLKNHLGIPE